MLTYSLKNRTYKWPEGKSQVFLIVHYFSTDCAGGPEKYTGTLLVVEMIKNGRNRFDPKKMMYLYKYHEYLYKHNMLNTADCEIILLRVSTTAGNCL